METYIVTIERLRVDSRFDNNYKWTVEVLPNPDSTEKNWDLRGYGFVRSQRKAKKRALKHLLGVHKDLKNGEVFGVVFETKGKVGEVERALSE